MSKIDDGGPAFPVVNATFEGKLRVAHEGMSLRDYFAAHAPPIPEEWPTVKWAMEFTTAVFSGWPGDKMEQYRGWGDYFEDHQINPEWLPDFEAARKEYAAVEARNTAAKLVAVMARETSWRWAYADVMLRERKDGE